MGASGFLQPIPQPPHDPTSWLLNARVGWRDALLVRVRTRPPDDGLTLAYTPGSDRSLTEASGSFGGLQTPANVALGPDCSIYLLDCMAAELKRFDPCACDFQVVPCLGGPGAGARQLRAPHAIGICSGNLFICDTGNHRLSVLALNGFVLRGHWRPPLSAYQSPHPLLSKPWEPYDVAFDGQGRVYVTDRANGCIHRFSPSGQWEKRLAGFGQISWIGIDCQDRMYVVIDDSQPTVRVVNADGQSAPVASSPEDLRPLFPCPPVEVDAAGRLHLGSLCAAVGEPGCKQSAISSPPDQRLESSVFDQCGNPVEFTPAPTSGYVGQGFYYSDALDSELYHCQWHRVILRGKIPTGARVVVSTYSAEARLSADQVQSLDNEWETNQTSQEMPDGEWDCLVRSGSGRFLWLRLELRGNGKVTPQIDSIEIEFPRISLRRYMPAVFGQEPVSADFTDRFLSLFDTTLRSIETNLDRQARYYDPLSAPSQREAKTGNDFLSWLASWIGLTLNRQWPEAKRRKFLKQAGHLFDLRGTREGLWRELLLFLDLEQHACCAGSAPQARCHPAPSNCAPVKAQDCAWQPPPLILEHFKLRRWLFLGAGRLGDQAVLWGKRIVNRSQLDETAQVGHTQLITLPDPLRDPFHVYAHRFTVFIPASFRTSVPHRKALLSLIKNAQPAATQAQIEYVEPRFRIGIQSMIGFDSVIARYPAGVTLNQTPLGPASVLTAPPAKVGGPSLEIGTQSRIGSTAKLD